MAEWNKAQAAAQQQVRTWMAQIQPPAEIAEELAEVLVATLRGEFRVPKSAPIEHSWVASGDSDEDSVLVQQGGFVYLRRYWRCYQQALCSLARRPLLKLEDMPQQDGAWLAISGAAGSGKSWLALRNACAFAEANDEPIAFVGPTGKAVERLRSSVLEQPQLAPLRQRKVHFNTLHGLLQKPLVGAARFTAKRLLPYALIVVDEVGMLDWELFAELSQALGKDTRLLLLGDPYQLAAVGVGGILPALMEVYPEHQHILHEQHRFQIQGPIGRMAEAARHGQLLPNFAQHHQHPDERQAMQGLRLWAQQQWPQKQPFEERLQKVVLSPWRHAEQGVHALNRAIQRWLYEAGLLSQKHGWCADMPVVVRANLHFCGLNNGERGLLIEQQRVLSVRFANQKTPLPLASIEEWLDPAFAMTVHQTQGSEFSEVALWLGEIDDTSNEWLSPSMLYTAITRAVDHIELFGWPSSTDEAP